MNKDEIIEIAKKLLKKAGIKTDKITSYSIDQVGNNRIHRISCNEKNFALKFYYSSSEEKNNRLISECNFLKFANHCVSHNVPKIYAVDNDTSSALYEYIDGKKILESKEITTNHIINAADFINKLNQNKVYAKGLKNASDACFTIKDHLSIIDNRLKEFKDLFLEDTKFSEIKEILNSKWHTVKNETHKKIRFYNLSLDEPLEIKKRIISPSDFGFHNILIKKDGTMVFFDFEYSGWDDPAKLVCDFFNQVAVPVSSIHYELFINNAFLNLKLNEYDKMRIETLLMVYKIKWCCIILNVFSLKNVNRRLFSNQNLNLINHRDNQLTKAKKLLESFQ